MWEPTNVGFRGIGILFRIGFRDLDRTFLRTCTVFLRIGFGSVWFHRSGFWFSDTDRDLGFFKVLDFGWFSSEDGFSTGFQGMNLVGFSRFSVFLGFGLVFRTRFGFFLRVGFLVFQRSGQFSKDWIGLVFQDRFWSS